MSVPMNQGTLVSAPIRPYTEDDKYAVAFADEVKGGLHIVATTAERNAISKDRRQIGMHCQVIDPLTKLRAEYILINEPDTDETADTDWAKCIVMAKEVLLSDGTTNAEDAIKAVSDRGKLKKMVYVVGMSDIAVGACPLELTCGFKMAMTAILMTIPKGTVLSKSLSANVEVYHSGAWNVVNNVTIPIGGPDAVSITLSAPYLVEADDRLRLNFIDADDTAKCVVATIGFTEIIDTTTSAVSK